MARMKVQCMNPRCGKEFWSRVNKVFVVKAVKKFISCPKCKRLFGVRELKLFEGLDINMISGIKAEEEIKTMDIKCPKCNVQLETKREPLRQRIIGTSMDYKRTSKFKIIKDEEMFIKKTLVPKDQLCKSCSNEEEHRKHRMLNIDRKQKEPLEEGEDVKIRVLTPAEAARNIRREINGKIFIDLREKARREKVAKEKREKAEKIVEKIGETSEVIVTKPKEK